MSDYHKSLRLGDLLLEKGLISPAQLRHAIELQKIRLVSRAELSTPSTKYELGEILIELGFISRNQLVTNLSWQRRLKATTAMMVFVAPLLTAACGGGAGASASGSNGNQQNSVAAQVVPSTSENVVSSSSSSMPSSISSMSASVVSSKSSSSVSSAPAVVPKSSSSISSAASQAKSSTSSSTASSQVDIINGPVQIYWTIPNTRENGDYLDITEIGGYALRYKLKSEAAFKTVLITDGFIDAYYFDYLTGDYQFEMATFDRDGVYSRFVEVGPAS